MSSTVAQVLDEVGGLLNDLEPGFEHVRWSVSDLLEFYNDAAKQVYLLRPELFSHDEVIKLVPGSLQGPLPDGCLFQKVVATVTKNADGTTTTNSSLTRKVDGALLAAFSGLECPASCGVGSGTADYSVSGFSATSTDPNHFYVDPPVPDDGKDHSVKIICLQEPADIPASDIANPVSDIASNKRAVDMGGVGGTVIKPNKMHNAIVEWMLYRAYTVDMESQESDTEMRFHLRHFYDILGISAKVDAAIANGKTTTQQSTAGNSSGQGQATQ